MTKTAIKPIGVRRLIKLTCLSGDLGNIKHSLNTAQRGGRIHRRLQKSHGKSYQAEVYLSQTVRINHQPFLIHGRADGIIMRKIPLIEEIKTSDVTFDQLPVSVLKLYWGQVKAYAYLLMKKRPALHQVKIRLTYVRTPNSIITKRDQLFTRSRAKAFFKKIIQAYGTRLALRSRIVKKRNRSARRFKFPFPHFRPGQYRMAAAVYKTIVFHKHLFCAAPTGTGKTISTLFPAVKAMGEGHLNRIFYLTAKQSTQQVAEATDRLMVRHGLFMKSITITAKDKITFPSEVNVDPQHNPYMVGYYDRLKPAIRDLLRHHNLITPPIIRRYAKRYTLDPFEFSLDTSVFCDVIICDYNYLFDPQVSLQRFFAARNPHNCFLIDEAHNLVSRSRDIYSASLNQADLNQLIKSLRRDRQRNRTVLPSLYRLRSAFRAEKSRLWRTPGHPHSINFHPVLKGLNQTIKRVTKACRRWLARQPQRDAITNRVINFDFACISYLTIGQLYNSAYQTRLIRGRSHQFIIQQFCIDPSRYLAHSLNLGGSAILFSATLSPMSYYRRTLGHEPNSLAYQLPSPFPARNRAVIITSYIQTTYRQRKTNQPKILRTIHQLVTGCPGHYLIFFPSYQYLNSVVHDFKQRYPSIRTLVQTPQLTAAQQSDFIDQFKQRPGKTLVGFAILGSSFAEGIDLRGRALIGVGVVSVGLPMINDQTNLVRKYFDRKNHRGFEYAYQLPGFNRVQQAAGRLIRGAGDIGIVVLMDTRFTQTRYRILMPPDWHPQLATTPNAFKTMVQRFWRQHTKKGRT